MLFEVPSSWEWCKLNELCIKFSTGPFGSCIHKSDYVTEKEFSFINPTNIINGKINKDKVAYISSDKAKELSKYKLEEDDVLLARRGDLTKCAVISKKDIGVYCGTGSFFLRLNKVNPKFFSMLYTSSYFQNILKSECVGATMNNLNQRVLSNISIPLPPINEQSRIVIEVEKWLALIDTIETNFIELRTTISLIKNKILDLAIHGELVPQNPNDESASELLKRINPKANITCDNGHSRKLPQSWSICKLNQVCLILDNKRKPINSRERERRIRNKQMSELYPYYGATGQVGYIDNYLIDGHYLLIGEDGAPFLDKYATKAYSINGKSWVNNHVHIIEPQIDFDYLLFYLNQLDYSPYVNGSTRLKLTQSDMKNIIVFLPPLEEQKRIARKVKEIFLFLNQIQDTLEAQ